MSPPRTSPISEPAAAVLGTPSLQRAIAGAAVGAVAASALVHTLRRPVLVALGIGVAAAAARGHRNAPVVWLAAALLPVQARLAYENVAPSISPTLEHCDDPVSPLALARVAEAAIVLGTLGASVALLGRRSTRALGLRLPSRRILVLSIAGPVVLVPLALLVGPMLTGPFFGRIDIDLGRPLALLPAVVLAIANATMEEAVFRGGVQGWGARSFGANGALVLQAALFGVTHVGPDFRNGLVMLPVLGAVTVGGLLAGVVVRRTGSLLLPIAIHAALDVPLYYAFACRLPPA
jgi:membrane protease YdiL (CAAX protease family)